jgi:hypothetical protein
MLFSAQCFSGARCSRSTRLSISASLTDTYPSHRAGSHRLSLRVVILTIICMFGSVFAHATTYYLSPSGNDSNNGLSTNYAWASPNHSLNCGDVILASAGWYNNANFYTGKWGYVNCPAGNSVAWLKCATFDTCKIYASANQGMWVDRSYWGVQGWEVSTNANDSYGACFLAAPNWNNPVTIHHIIFANDVANGCSQSGFESVNRGYAGVDYFNVIGSVAYNAAQGSNTCASGISVLQPVQSDWAAGTHILIAGNFSYANMEPSYCNGGSPTDGEGIIFDNFDGHQSGIAPYGGQAVAYRNILIGNGSKGIEVDGNQAGTYHASVWLNQNTAWGNNSATNQTWIGCAEISVYAAKDVHSFGNIAAARSATGCGGNAIYGMTVSVADGSDTADNNYAFGYNGNNIFVWDVGSFFWNSDNHFTSPAFRNAYVPGAPNCGGTANVSACMAGMVYDFTPTAANAGGYGYQPPLSYSVADPLFPRWLCSANLPSGLITMGCS